MKLTPDSFQIKRELILRLKNSRFLNTVSNGANLLNTIYNCKLIYDRLSLIDTNVLNNKVK